MIKEHHVKDGRIFFSPTTNCGQSNAVHKCLTKLINDINSDLVSEACFQSNLKILIEDLKCESWACLDTGSIHVFGSSSNGFRSNTSDVDCVVDLPENGIDPALCRFKNYLKNSKLFELKEVIRKANVPIIKVTHNKTQLECDISFACPAINRNDVINNTQLLRKYSTLYPQIARSFQFLKYILSFTKFGSVRTSGLSTYTHIIMFIYFLTHGREPPFPHIDIWTHNIEPKQNMTYQVHLSGASMIIAYLKFIACEMNSSRLSIDIRTSDLLQRHQTSSGSLGRLHIPDPYVTTKNLGKYMKDPEVYNFKLYCFHLLEYLGSCTPSSCYELQDWCDNYEDALLSAPEIHHLSQPMYQAIRATKIKSTPNTKASVPLQTNDYWTVTITQSCLTGSVPVVQNINPTIPPSCWYNVIGSVVDSIRDRSHIVDSSSPKLQCVLVFSRETVIEQIMDVLQSVPTKKLVISSCLKPRQGAHVYLTNYLNGISKQTDVSQVKRIYVYNPTFQLPDSLWELLKHSIPGQLYLIMPYAVDLQEGLVDRFAQLYSGSTRAYAKYLYTVHLQELNSLLALTNSNEGCLPDNLEIYQILYGLRAEDL